MDFEDDWALLRRKLEALDPELVDELLELAQSLRRWIKDGDNDQVRQTGHSLQRRLTASEGPRKTALTLALLAFQSVPFEVDDPEYPEEPYAFRAWRTVENGFTVMDAKAVHEPDFRVFPRVEWKHSV